MRAWQVRRAGEPIDVLEAVELDPRSRALAKSAFGSPRRESDYPTR